MEYKALRERTPSLEVRRALLDAAESVLSEFGPAGFTIRNVASEAGAAPAGVYSRFGDKNGLALELRARGFDKLRRYVADAQGADPIERLGDVGARYRNFALRNPHLYSTMFEDALALRDSTLETDRPEEAAFEALVTHVRRALAEFGRGATPDDFDEAIEIAQQIWAAVHGAVSLELKGLGRTRDPAASYFRLLELLISGVSAMAFGSVSIARDSSK